MNITYRQPAKITIIFLIFFFVTGSFYKTHAKAGPNKKLAVLIETKENDRSLVRSHYDIALAIKQLFEFHLYNNKVGADIQLISKKNVHNHIRSMNLSDYYGLIIIKFTLAEKQLDQSIQRRVTKKHQPQISLRFSSHYFEVKNDSIAEIYNNKNEVSSQKHWFETKDSNSKAAAAISQNPEPVEYVIQRVVESISRDLPLQKQIFKNPQQVISAALFIDSSFIDFADKNWIKKYDDMMSYASSVLSNQFSYGLNVTSLVTTDIKKGESVSMHRLFRRLKQNEENLTERLVIYLINYNNREDYFLSNHYDNIGLAEIGRNQILINEVPSPKIKQTEWQSIYNALTLLHEIGHSFGAIHVSDKYSIMNHSLTWLAVNQFDPINKQIVNDAMNGKLLFIKKEDYLTYVTDHILNSEYYLVDIPSFYYTFFKRKSDSLLFKTFSNSERYKPFLYAASGFGYMEGKQYKLAELEFKKALDYLPNQASLYYYLSLCTEGETSRRYLEKAYRMGYYLAEVEYQKSKK